MHDFLQPLSFHTQPAPVTAPRGGILHWVMRSFDDSPPFTAFRPVPHTGTRRKPRPRAATPRKA